MSAAKPVAGATADAPAPAAPMFEKLTLIGVGLIGASIALKARREGLARQIVGATRRQDTADTTNRLGIVDSCGTDLAAACDGADLVIICTPVGACGEVTKIIAPRLKPGAILSEVGSVKQAVIRDMRPHVPAGVHYVPAHPIAGTEHSGPEAGFPELFEGRWAIVTPLPGEDRDAADKVAEFWRRCGSMVEFMTPEWHDKVLGIVSHLPHLIAYTIVGTADDMAGERRSEVIKFAAGGFRDFTRIAASDPTMWRDVFLNNRDAVLEILGRFQEDLFYLQRAIRWGEGDKLFELFSRTRAIRRALIDMKQA
ncbi:prephenate/arogenate dehydrogenase family protein [Vineibacter terrae]|uniref:prephenate/arogenate dehydrogenase family protein n=1 Tax=Vineibacter terrae TaxID=2586908 RepID=UPI0039C94E73